MAEATGKAPAEDPSMEDILASIRRILNDDDVPAAAQPQLSPPVEAAAASTSAEPAADDGVFVLDQTMMIEEPVAVSPDEPFAPEHLAPQDVPPSIAQRDSSGEHLTSAPKAVPHHEPVADEPLLAPSVAAAASASMGALVRVAGQQQVSVYRGGPTLEDMVREELRPLVKTWLDENLAGMVERLVRAEIARVSGK